jgi:glutathione S-transferase
MSGIRLRYFDARARGQLFRAFFAARDIEFVDERIPLDTDFASWQAIRDDQALSGPLKRLPVLHHGDRLISEVIVIAAYLHRQFGDVTLLGDEGNVHHDTIVSVAYTDLVTPIAGLIWSEVLTPGVDLNAAARIARSRLNRTLDVVESALNDWRWVHRIREHAPTIADCVLWEALDQIGVVFGSHLGGNARPTLRRFHEEHPGRAAFERTLALRPCQITGRAGEPDVIARIQALLAG